MATREGWRGSAYLGANKIAEITGWSATADGQPLNVEVLGNEWQMLAYTLRKVEGNFDGFADDTDANGQVAIWNQFMSGGTMAAIWLYLYISGSTGIYGEAMVTPTRTVQVADIHKFSCPFRSHNTWYKVP